MQDDAQIDFSKIYGFEHLGLDGEDVVDLKGSLASSRLGAKIGGLPPVIQVSPPDFSMVACETVTVAVFEFTNTGSGNLEIFGLAIVDGENTVGVPVVSDPIPIDTIGPIGPNSTSQITVTFTPEDTGPFDFALQIISNAENDDFEFNVSGSADCDPIDEATATPNVLNRLSSVPTNYLNERLSPAEQIRPAQVTNQDYVGGKIGAGLTVTDVNTDDGNESLTLSGNQQHADGLYGSWSDLEIGRNTSDISGDNRYLQLGLGVDRALSVNSLIGVMLDVQVLDGTGLDDGATSRTTAAAIGPYFAYRATSALTIDASYLIGKATHKLDDGAGETASVSESYQQLTARMSAWSDFGAWTIGRDLSVTYRSNDRDSYDLGATSFAGAKSEFGTAKIGVDALYSSIDTLGGITPMAGFDLSSNWGDSVDDSVTAGLEIGIAKAFENGGRLNASVGTRGLGGEGIRSDFASFDYQFKF